MDLGAVKDAPAGALACGAIAAARNARGLVEDAELLSGAGRLARAYSLAGLAVEEVGKADSLASLAGMPENLRARAPVGRMLEWHQMKLIVGLLTTAVPFTSPGKATRFASMPPCDVAGMLDKAQAFAEHTDQLKQRGAAGVELSLALISAFSETGRARSPEAAADVLRNAVAKLRS